MVEWQIGYDLVRELILACGILVALIFVGYILVGGLLSLQYSSKRTENKAENVKLVITTIASESVRNALMNTIEHTTENFGEYDIHCVLDEGSDLKDELVAMDSITTIVVPDTYTCSARAKGRAINYFIETHVEDGFWYGFLDDDNLILDDEFLYEIPHYEQLDYAAMNPVLTPREGGSLTTFVADHMRLMEDLTSFRVFTGLLGKPYIGFHGELLCARGSVLKEIGFDHDTMVEDFVFAMKLIDNGWKTWQSKTRVSILSPHTITAFYKQRRRWFLGIIEYLPESPRITKYLIGSRSLLWTLGITGNWIMFPLWLWAGGLRIALRLQLAVNLAGLLYAGTCLLSARDLSRWRAVGVLFLIPICSFMEHTAPLYGIFRPNNDFVVIEK
jgi:cellulose synthase/poly-beta-1,6-N-acetylglucosamine synthase-like glycosyltransferase